MNTARTDAELERDYQAFIAELTRLGQRYGIALQAIGGVLIADAPQDFATLRYRADRSSGDLLPEFD